MGGLLHNAVLQSLDCMRVKVVYVHVFMDAYRYVVCGGLKQVSGKMIGMRNMYSYENDWRQCEKEDQGCTASISETKQNKSNMKARRT